MKLDYITLILLASEQESTESNLPSPIDSMLTLKCNGESKLYAVRGNAISSVFLRGIRFSDLSEQARKTIITASKTTRILGNEVPVIELDVQGRLLALNVLPKLELES